jgi:hypothetical protein
MFIEYSIGALHICLFGTPTDNFAATAFPQNLSKAEMAMFARPPKNGFGEEKEAMGMQVSKFAKRCVFDLWLASINLH